MWAAGLFIKTISMQESFTSSTSGSIRMLAASVVGGAVHCQCSIIWLTAWRKFTSASVTGRGYPHASEHAPKKWRSPENKAARHIGGGDRQDGRAEKLRWLRHSPVAQGQRDGDQNRGVKQIHGKTVTA